MDTTALDSLISSYAYNQYNLVRQPLTILHNPRDREIQIFPFYRHHERPKSGTCSELTGTAFRELRQKYPELFVARVVGQETRFSDHWFLIVTEADFMYGMHEMRLKDYMKVPGYGQHLAVDPSFRRVARIDEGFYNPNIIYHPEQKVLVPNSVNISPEGCRPLAITNDGDIIGITFDYLPQFTLGLQIRGRFTPLSDPSLEAALEDLPEIAAIARHIAKAPVKEVQTALAPRNLVLL